MATRAQFFEYRKVSTDTFAENTERSIFQDDVRQTNKTKPTEFVVIEDIGANAVRWVINCTATGSVDGSNTTFTLSHTPLLSDGSPDDMLILVDGALADSVTIADAAAGTIVVDPAPAVSISARRYIANDLDVYIQIILNSTAYFVNTDGTIQRGIPAKAVPYPLGYAVQGLRFALVPPVYVLPGQNWDVLITNFTGAIDACTDYRAICKYTLFDGPDSQFAVELYKYGISVTPKNVDWYKRMLLEKKAGVGSAAPAPAQQVVQKQSKTQLAQPAGQQVVQQVQQSQAGGQQTGQ